MSAHAANGDVRGVTTIVHPTDFSEEADRAESEAVRLAQRLGAELVLLHISVETPLYGEHAFGMGDVKRIYEAQARWADGHLATRAEALNRRGVSTRWMRRTGVVDQLITDTAREQAADYIVMGTHGRSGIARLMLGSVADRVVRTAPCPVLMVRPK